MGWRYNDYDDYDDYKDDQTLIDYRTPADAFVIKGRISANSQRGPIGTEWWGREWVLTMERLGLEGRIERGRRYARNGSVSDLEISYGMAFARVKGNLPYRTAIHIRLLPDKEWDKALEALSQQAIYSAKLLAGEMPSDIDTIFQEVGVSLFPKSIKEISFECSCPDFGNPCKHAAAVYYLVAEQLDADPFILFHLRGRKREQVLAALRKHRGSEADTALHSVGLTADLSRFWQGFETKPMSALPTIPNEPLVVRQLGDPPNKADILAIYKHIAKAAYRRLIDE